MLCQINYYHTISNNDVYVVGGYNNDNGSFCSVYYLFYYLMRGRQRNQCHIKYTIH